MNGFLGCSTNIKPTNGFEVEKIILTASGGPFRDLNISEFSKINIKDALKQDNLEFLMGDKTALQK